uniref:Putative secreted protein n=1 Tax=Ixodes ricinus TaxID=34613 RepID=A0A6B0UDW2_IXORI
MFAVLNWLGWLVANPSAVRCRTRRSVVRVFDLCVYRRVLPVLRDRFPSDEKTGHGGGRVMSLKVAIPITSRKSSSKKKKRVNASGVVLALRLTAAQA